MGAYFLKKCPQGLFFGSADTSSISSQLLADSNNKSLVSAKVPKSAKNNLQFRQTGFWDLFFKSKPPEYLQFGNIRRLSAKTSLNRREQSPIFCFRGLLTIVSGGEIFNYWIKSRHRERLSAKNKCHGAWWGLTFWILKLKCLFIDSIDTWGYNFQLLADTNNF